jgi:hypothetical protein
VAQKMAQNMCRYRRIMNLNFVETIMTSFNIDIYQYPQCSSEFKLYNVQSYNTFGAKLYTDGNIKGPYGNHYTLSNGRLRFTAMFLNYELHQGIQYGFRAVSAIEP